MNTTAGKLQSPAGKTPMQSLEIQSFSYEERASVLPLLTTSFADCGGWVIDRKTLSPTTVAFRIEIQLSGILDLYVAILSAGVELTRAGHLALTDLCTCRKYLRFSADLGQVVALRIEVSFLEDVTLHSLLTTLAPPA
jgi:hypothetical protein